MYNQSISQSINQSIDRSINQSVSQSVSQSVNQSVIQSVNQSVIQSINQSIYLSIYLSIYKGVLLGSVVKCLIRNRGILGSSRTGSSGLFFVGVPLSKTLQNPSLALMKPKKTRNLNFLNIIVYVYIILTKICLN